MKRRSRVGASAGCVLAFLALAVASGSAAGATRSGAAGTTIAAQRCVELWNAMNMVTLSSSQRKAAVLARPCRVLVAYEAGRNPEHYFRCATNEHRAFACAGHAGSQALDGKVRAWNARIGAAGKLRLLAPPTIRVTVELPAWVERYVVIDGYIAPFDTNGGVSAGLEVVNEGSPEPVACAGVEPDRSTGLVRCRGGRVCFVSGRQSVAAGDPALCPDDPGSRRFSATTLTDF